uniref:Uncharacterized protein n=1 Tax=Anopheles merus TaxID=30066 RepID=A0A182UMF5_ANOME
MSSGLEISLSLYSSSCTVPRYRPKPHTIIIPKSAKLQLIFAGIGSVGPNVCGCVRAKTVEYESAYRKRAIAWRVASFASTVHAKRALLYNCSSFFKFVAIALGLGPSLAVTVVGLAGLLASAYTESPHQFVVAEFIVPVSRDEFQLPSFRFHTGPLRGGR